MPQEPKRLRSGIYGNHVIVSWLCCVVLSCLYFTDECRAGLEFRAVLISTVRSRHLIDKLDDDDISDDDSDITDCRDFGFLSEQKLLNTAMTRAKSWLGVVGDPVALCSVGECSRIWRTYVKHCAELASILPPEMSLAEIWRLVESLSCDEYPRPDHTAGMISCIIKALTLSSPLVSNGNTS